MSAVSLLEWVDGWWLILGRLAPLMFWQSNDLVRQLAGPHRETRIVYGELRSLWDGITHASLAVPPERSATQALQVRTQRKRCDGVCFTSRTPMISASRWSAILPACEMAPVSRV